MVPAGLFAKTSSGGGMSLALGKKTRSPFVCCSAARERGRGGCERQRERERDDVMVERKESDVSRTKRFKQGAEEGEREYRNNASASSRRSFGVAALSSSVCLYRFFGCPSTLVAEELGANSDSSATLAIGGGGGGVSVSLAERPTMTGPPMDAAATTGGTAASPPQATTPSSSGASETGATPPSPPTSPPPPLPTPPPAAKDEKTPDRFMVRKSRLREIQELRDSLATKEFALMQKQQELEDKDRSMNVLTEQLALEKKLRDILIEEKDRAIEEAKLAAGLCSQGGMMP